MIAFFSRLLVHLNGILTHAHSIMQTKLGAQLTSLETRWTELISNVLQIELANTALEAEVRDLARRETELSAM
jgi:hypothetical protein